MVHMLVLGRPRWRENQEDPVQLAWPRELRGEGHRLEYLSILVQLSRTMSDSIRNCQDRGVVPPSPSGLHITNRILTIR